MRNKKSTQESIEVVFIVILSLALIGLLFACFGKVMMIAYADSTYIQAPVSDLKNNENSLKSSLKVSFGDEDSFYVPESYYVEINGLAFGNTYYATYMGESNCFVTLDNIERKEVSNISTIFPNVSLSLTENVEIDGTLIDGTYQIAFMGYNEDSTKIFVRATKDSSKVFGFVNTSKLNEFKVPYEANTQAQRNELLSSEDFNPNDELPQSTSKGIRIAIIVCLAIAIVIITIVFFVPSRKERHVKLKSENNNYDESKKL